MNCAKKKRIALACGTLIYALSTVFPVVGQKLNYLGSPAEVFTNAIGVLQCRMVDVPDSTRRELTANQRVRSIRMREFYLLLEQAETNRIMTLTGSDRKILDELSGLAGERVRVEGRLVEFLKSDLHRELYHLVVTNVTELDVEPKIAGKPLNAAEAHRLARKLARTQFDVFIDREKRSAPPRLISGRWVWIYRQGSGRGDVEVQVAFAPDGSSPEVVWQFFSSETYVPR